MSLSQHPAHQTQAADQIQQILSKSARTAHFLFLPRRRHGAICFLVAMVLADFLGAICVLDRRRKGTHLCWR